MHTHIRTHTHTQRRASRAAPLPIKVVDLPRSTIIDNRTQPSSCICNGRQQLRSDTLLSFLKILLSTLPYVVSVSGNFFRTARLPYPLPLRALVVAGGSLLFALFAYSPQLIQCLRTSATAAPMRSASSAESPGAHHLRTSDARLTSSSSSAATTEPDISRLPCRVRVDDDTLPSPPVSALVPGYAGDDVAAARFPHGSLLEDHPPLRWMLQESVAERQRQEEVEEDGRGKPATANTASTECDADASADIGGAVEAVLEGSPQKTRATSSSSAALGQANGGHSTPQQLSHRLLSPTDRVAVLDAPQQPTHAVPQSTVALSAERIDGGKSAACSSSSSLSEPTLVIAVPPRPALRTSPEAMPPVSDAMATSDTTSTTADGGQPSARRRPVLVSPAMAEEFPESDLRMSPGSADTVDLRSRCSHESRRAVREASSWRDASSLGRTEGQEEEAGEGKESFSGGRESFFVPPISAAALSQEGATRSPSSRRDAEAAGSGGGGGSSVPRSSSPSLLRASFPYVDLLQLSPLPLEKALAATRGAGRAASGSTSSARGVTAATPEETSPALRSVLQRLRLQVNQAERAAALQKSLYESAMAEKADMQVQLEELLHINSELERRMQESAAVWAEEAQLRSSERVASAAKQQRALQELSAAHERDLQRKGQEAETVREQLAESKKAMQDAQTELAETREELQAVMRELLDLKEELAVAQRAQADAEQRCQTLRRHADLAVTLEHTAQERATALVCARVALRTAAERAAVAELALQTLCGQLNAIAEHPRLMDGSHGETSALSFCGLVSLSDTQSSEARTRGSDRGAGGMSVIAELRRAVMESMQEDDISAAVEAVLGSDGAGASPGSTTQLGGEEEMHGTGAPGAASPAPLHSLSDACRASFHQHRQQVQYVVSQVAETCRRVARETRAAADTRAADMERVLSAELRLLRSQVEMSHQNQQQQGDALRANVVRRDAADDATQHSQPTVNSAFHSEVDSPTSRENITIPITAINTGDTHDNSAVAVDVAALHSSLEEAQRALLLERRRTAHLTREVEGLCEARDTATCLAQVEETVREVRLSVSRLLHDAVVDLQRSYAALSSGHDNARWEGSGGGGGILQRASIWSDDNTAATASPTSPERAPVSCTDGAMLRAIYKAVLLAEAQVERVGDELLDKRRHGHYPAPLPTAPAEGTTGRGETGSRRPVSLTPACRAHLSGWQGTAPVPRSATQQLVFEEMQALLHRSRAESSGGDTRGSSDRTPSSISQQSRYSPDGARRLLGTRPLPPSRDVNIPSGAVTTPAREGPGAAPSPYVRAYMHSLSNHSGSGHPAPPTAASRHASSTNTAHASDTSTHEALSSTTALRLLDGMSTTAQEMCNVGKLLEVLRDNEAIREERQGARLQQWERRITESVEAALSRVTAALAPLHPTHTALALLSRRRGERLQVASLAQTPPRPSCVEPVSVAPVQRPQVCLADVLAGKAARAGTPFVRPASSSAGSSGAVVFHTAAR